MSWRYVINKLLAFTRYRLIKVKPALNRRYECHLKLGLEGILAYQLLRSEDFFFVQIGANDGMRADDISEFVKKHKLKGIVIEPLQDMFSALVDNYRDYPEVTPINAAIDVADRVRKLYRIDPALKGIPDWCQGIASFDKSHVMSAEKKIPAIKDHIIEEKVRCISFPSLMQEYGINKIDLLQIDAEGHDYEIIKSIDFDAVQPGVIRYEESGLSRDDKWKCLNLLMDRGYKIFSERNDIIAVKFS
jgi:FkbM family methyltransferase